jgi:hypothetical protein
MCSLAEDTVMGGPAVEDVVVPAVLADTLTAGTAEEIAALYGDQVVFPQQIIVDDTDDSHRSFPGWPTRVLVIAHENQGVVSWGVPLGDPSPPVLVGGERDDSTNSPGTVVYAPSVEAFIAARRWDRTCWNREPLVQAQAAVLDDISLAVLRTRFHERPATQGWPGHTQYRFEANGVKIMLWSGSQQCDWWLSGTDTGTLATIITDLMDISDLRETLWSNDVAGDTLLRQIHGGRR